MAVENLLQMIRKQPWNKRNKSWCRVSIIGDGSERGIVGVLQCHSGTEMPNLSCYPPCLLLMTKIAGYAGNTYSIPHSWEVHHAAKVPHRTAEWNPGRRYLKLSRSSTKMVTILVLLAGSYLSHGILRKIRIRTHLKTRSYSSKLHGYGWNWSVHISLQWSSGI